jgi:hypothetical protein
MQVSIAQVRRGEHVAVQDDQVVGRIVGDYATGFWAIRTDGLRVPETFATPDEAAEVLALEHLLTPAVAASTV